MSVSTGPGLDADRVWKGKGCQEASAAGEWPEGHTASDEELGCNAGQDQVVSDPSKALAPRVQVHQKKRSVGQFPTYMLDLLMPVESMKLLQTITHPSAQASCIANSQEN